LVPSIQPVREDVPNVAFATRILQGIILGLLVDVTIISPFASKPKSIIGLVVGSDLGGGGSCSKQREA